MSCSRPEFHAGDHCNVVGYAWPQSTELPDSGRLLYGVAGDAQAAKIRRVDGVFALPATGIVLVTPSALLAILSEGIGSVHWLGGRVEVRVDGAPITLWPVLDG